MHELVKDYCGKQLSNSADLKTTACCDASSVPPWLRPLLARIYPEVLERYYGCGLVAPPQVFAACRRERRDAPPSRQRRLLCTST